MYIKKYWCNFIAVSYTHLDVYKRQVEIQLDWAEQRVLETTLFPLGLLKFQFHYLRPAGDHFQMCIRDRSRIMSLISWLHGHSGRYAANCHLASLSLEAAALRQRHSNHLGWEVVSCINPSASLALAIK